MSEPIIPRMPGIEAPAAQIKVTASSSRLSTPLVIGTNHVLGWKMGSLIHFITMETGDTGTSATHTITTYRYPNCDYLLGWFWVDAYTQSPATITCTAGGGAATAETVYDTGGGTEVIVLFPWDSADATWQSISYVANGCTIGAAMISMVPRAELGAGDTFVEYQHSSSHASGFGPNKFIISTGGTEDARSLQNTILTAKDAIRPQAVSWTDPSSPRTMLGNAYAKIFPTDWSLDFEFRHIANQFKSTDTIQTYRVYLRTYMAEATGYEWKVTTSGDTATKAGLTRAAYGWDYVTVDVDATSDDSFLIEAKTDTAGTGEFYCNAVSIIKE